MKIPFYFVAPRQARLLHIYEGMRDNQLTRRHLVQVGGSVGVGVATNSFESVAVGADIRMQAESFFDPYHPTALRWALDYAGDDGFVASLPQLLHA